MTESNTSPQYLTIKQLTTRFPAFSEGALRWIVFQANENGLTDSRALLRIGRKLVIDVDRFVVWLESHRESVSRHAR